MLISGLRGYSGFHALGLLPLAGLFGKLAPVRSLFLQMTAVAALRLRLKLILSLLCIAYSCQDARSLGFLGDLSALSVHDTVKFVVSQLISALLLDTLLKLFNVLEIFSLLRVLRPHLVISQRLVELLVLPTSLLFLK
jgi:hypothetical protein